MFSPLFWFFAALTLLCGIGVVANRNPVASALCLVISFMGLAALFVGLDAYLVAVLEVLVYAGAVMVLFLFIIMLLDLRAEQRRRFNWLGIGGGGLVTLAFIGELVFVLAHHPSGSRQFPPLRPSVKVEFEGYVNSRTIDPSGLVSANLTAGADAPAAQEAAVPAPSVVTGSPTPLTGAPPKIFKETLYVPRPDAQGSSIDDVREIGGAIFTNYNLPLQIVGVLLLVSTVGVVILSRRELK